MTLTFWYPEMDYKYIICTKYDFNYYMNLTLKFLYRITIKKETIRERK